MILGSGGFISSGLQKMLKERHIKIMSIGKSKLNLKKENASEKLRKKIKNNDVVIFIAAEVPVKNIEMFINNIKICKTVCDTLQKKKIKHLVYISSDAIYADVKGKISEKSIASPNSLHGLMHLTRELMLKNKFEKILCILRPTLIYGSGDTHNGYGPNRFINLALKNKSIPIFGNGEEKRDHVWINDVTEIIYRCLVHTSIGKLNMVTGKVISFFEIAPKDYINQ